MSDTDASAAAWIPLARSGSREALGRMLDACRAYLLLVARQELGADLQSKGSASDLVQETFLEAQRDFGRFHGGTEEELLAWLRQILLNNLANFARRYRDAAKRCVYREVSLEGGGPLPARPAPDASPGEQAVEAERAATLRRAVECLPEDYRRVLVLRYEEQKSFEEIGRLLGRSANAARKLWARAVERLQQFWEPPGGP
jgi:RNA polymerase sigma-70 factor (ECF subfamily)